LRNCRSLFVEFVSRKRQPATAATVVFIVSTTHRCTVLCGFSNVPPARALRGVLDAGIGQRREHGFGFLNLRDKTPLRADT